VSVEVTVPDIGDFADVPVIEILVKPGDEVAPEDPLVTLESDKATMDVPAPEAGTVEELRVKIGDKVSEGSVILTLAGEGEGTAAPSSENGASAAPEEPEPDPDRVDVLVLGGGPGGYTAAFRAADLGLSVVLVERHERLGGVCLNVGCIPSKALLHIAKVVGEAEEAGTQGVSFGPPEVDLGALREWKEGVVKKLTGGLVQLAKSRKVRVVRGTGTFTGPNTLDVDGEEIAFAHAIIAAGSTAVRLPGLPDDPRVMDSTGALELEDVPKRLLVVGGGIIGLEMATVYDALGSAVTVVELQDQLIPGCDADLVKPLQKRIAGRYAAIHLGVSVKEVKAQKNGLHVTFEGEKAPKGAIFDRVLVAVGRRPNGSEIGAGAAGVTVDERGFVPVDAQRRTNVPHIFAIGDVVGEPMLAHKASHEAKVAAEVIAGEAAAFDVRSIPSVAYTDPEVAWTGLTETEARAEDVAFERQAFPWAASGRALTVGRPEGMTKVLVDPESRRVLGVGIVGVNAGELIAEAVHAIEMGADAEDIGLSIHPHPTLSETVMFAAEMAAGTITDIPLPRKRRAAA
jgi:dihydrolipoamide dehydrogenase